MTFEPPKLSTWIVASLASSGVLLFGAIAFFVLQRPSLAELPYSRFRELVDRAVVARVPFDGSRLTGSLSDAAASTAAKAVRQLPVKAESRASKVLQEHRPEVTRLIEHWKRGSTRRRCSSRVSAT
jgi:hypothetical protein